MIMLPPKRPQKIVVAVFPKDFSVLGEADARGCDIMSDRVCVVSELRWLNGSNAGRPS